MSDGLWLFASFLSALCGMAWLALAMPQHWSQACGSAPSSVLRSRKLRTAGAMSLLLSLIACLIADHPSMASLVWLMTMSATALIVAMTLAYRPRWLSWLVAKR